MDVIKVDLKPVPIVADGLQATRVIGEGRWIPIIVVDPSERPDVQELLRHVPGREGEAQTQWGFAKKNPSAVFLHVIFKSPVRCDFHLLFDAGVQGILVDYAIDAEALYLQAGRPGDRVSQLTEEPRLLITAPVTRELRDAWEKIFLAAVVDRLKKKGLRRRAAKTAAPTVVADMRRIGKMRFKPLS